LKPRFSRRRFLLDSATSSAAVGWTRTRRAWATSTIVCDSSWRSPPGCECRSDPAERAAFAQDFGNIVSRIPCDVVSPRSTADVEQIVRLARRQGLHVAVNGQSGTPDSRESHSSFGQALVDRGLSIDVRELSAIRQISGDSAIVGAGVLWSQLFDAAAERGRTPPVLTDYLRLSVGGTLSVGGIGGAAYRYGVQADNVLALEVVTGRGDHVTCSPTRSPDLFHAVLAGAGQCGIIVSAQVRLVASETSALVVNLFYDDLHLYLEDQLFLLAEQSFDHLEGQIVRNVANTGWRYMIEAAVYFTSPPPDSAALLAGLRDNRAEARLTRQSYRDFAFRVDTIVAAVKAAGRWTTQHPWINLFIPASKAAEFISELVATLTPDDLGVLGPGIIAPALLYPFETARTRRRLFKVPSEPIAFHLGLLRIPLDDPVRNAALLEQNRRLYDRVVALGGKRYIIGAIPGFTQADWRQHFGPEWEFLSGAKARFDPDNVLTPGQGIFP
jgi:cytokinin dehydrogenase